MPGISTDYIYNASGWLCISTLFYFLMNGAQIFETAVLVPRWSAAPPQSLVVLQGKYAPDLKKFWIIIHCLHEISFILAIIFCWKLVAIRNWLLVLFAIHMVVRVWTIGWFAPHIIKFQQIANTDNIIPGLAAQTARWRRLNYIRVAVFVAVSVCLLPLCLQLMRLRFG